MYFSSSFDLVFGVSRFGDGGSSAVGTELELGSLLLVCWLSLRTHLTMLCSRHSVENGLAWLCLRNPRSHSPVAGSLKVLTGPSCLVCSPPSFCLGRSWHILFPSSCRISYAHVLISSSRLWVLRFSVCLCCPGTPQWLLVS